jgi:hypothetical protein
VPALETDLQNERDHLDASRKALRRMREHAEDLFATGDQVAGDAYAAETLGRHLARRIAELADNPDTPLFFGRLDIDHERYHIGRRHVTDPAGEPMVLDWRAPRNGRWMRWLATGQTAGRQYHCTGALSISSRPGSPTHDCGCAHQVNSSAGRFSTNAICTTSTSMPRFEDGAERICTDEERLVTPEPTGLLAAFHDRSHPAYRGPMTHTAILPDVGTPTRHQRRPGNRCRIAMIAESGEFLPASRARPRPRMRSNGPRVGPMRNIVATIQPEQDALVRAEFDKSICVQGAPGTGNPNPESDTLPTVHRWLLARPNNAQSLRAPTVARMVGRR